MWLNLAAASVCGHFWQWLGEHLYETRDRRLGSLQSRLLPGVPRALEPTACGLPVSSSMLPRHWKSMESKFKRGWWVDCFGVVCESLGYILHKRDKVCFNGTRKWHRAWRLSEELFSIVWRSRVENGCHFWFVNCISKPTGVTDTPVLWIVSSTVCVCPCVCVCVCLHFPECVFFGEQWGKSIINQQQNCHISLSSLANNREHLEMPSVAPHAVIGYHYFSAVSVKALWLLSEQRLSFFFCCCQWITFLWNTYVLAESALRVTKLTMSSCIHFDYLVKCFWAYRWIGWVAHSPAPDLLQSYFTGGLRVISEYLSARPVL